MGKKGRRPQNEKLVPFQQLLPLTLRDRVSGKGDKSVDVACIPQMQALFTCLRKHDFEQAKCSSEVSTFQKCYEGFRNVRFQKQEQSGVLPPGAKTFTAKQLNMFLKKFPHPK